MESTNNLVTESVADLTSEKLEHEKDAPKKPFKWDLRRRFNYVKEVITVEPLLGSYVMASIICSAALNALEFEKSCKSNHDYNDTVCDSILSGTFKENNFTEENEAVQQSIIKMHSWQQPLQSAMPIILILFLGSYSDRHKMRKPFLVLPIFGEFFSVLGCIVSVLFMRELPLQVQGAVQTIVPSLFGGPTMIIMASFAYIADVSTLEMRTLRIGVLQIVLNVCSPIAQLLSGVLLQSFGYIEILIITGAIYAFGFLYGLFYLKEPHKPVDIKKNKSLLKDLFDLQHVIETITLLTKKSKDNDRKGIIIIMVLLAIFAGVVGGEGSVFFLFTQEVYQWTAVNFSYFLTVNTIIHLVGNIVALPIFANVLKLSDLTITAVSFLDKVVSNLIFIIFTTTTGLYAGTIVSIIIGIASIAIRSQATKVVSENDLGKAQSIFAIVEAVAPAVVIPIYNQVIYSYTISSFPQAFFVLGVVLYFVGIALVMWLYFQKKANPTSTEIADTNGVNNVKNGNGKIQGIVETTHI